MAASGNGTADTAVSNDVAKVFDQGIQPSRSDADGEQCSSPAMASSAAASTEGEESPAGPECIQQGATKLAHLLHQRQQRLLEQFFSSGPDLFKHLPLLQACLYEAMRLYPAGAPGAPRWADLSDLMSWSHIS